MFAFIPNYRRENTYKGGKKTNNKIDLNPCPFCGATAYIDILFKKTNITAHHTKKCKMKPDTWLISSEFIKKQIKAWNRRSNG